MASGNNFFTVIKTPLKFVTHSKKVLDIAVKYGWLPGARYTNLRDIKTFNQIGFIDIDWKNYNFAKHLEAVKATNPILTVARDIETHSDLDLTLEQANKLSEYCQFVIVVPKAYELGDSINTIIPSNFLLGYSVPSKYGGTKIESEKFKRPVHILGGRPDIQKELANKMSVFSLDCNRFTLDAAFGDYFDGERFRKHPIGGYARCIEESIININKLWQADV